MAKSKTRGTRKEHRKRVKNWSIRRQEQFNVLMKKRREDFEAKMIEQQNQMQKLREEGKLESTIKPNLEEE